MVRFRDFLGHVISAIVGIHGEQPCFQRKCLLVSPPCEACLPVPSFHSSPRPAPQRLVGGKAAAYGRNCLRPADEFDNSCPKSMWIPRMQIAGLPNATARRWHVHGNCCEYWARACMPSYLFVETLLRPGL